MAGISIETNTTVSVNSSLGTPINPGDKIIIRAGSEDIICKFVEVSKGYFKTTTLDGQQENKYRLSTITESSVVESISVESKESKEDE